MLYLDIVPHEIYQLIQEYIGRPKLELERFSDQWNLNLKIINKCYNCKRDCTVVALSYNCNCNNDKYSSMVACNDGCKNQLICWDCAH